MQDKAVLLTTSFEHLLESLKAQNFSGILQLLENDRYQWSFFLHLGRLIYATGGNHSVRRFCRQVNTLFPDFNWYEVNRKVPQAPEIKILKSLGWEYECIRLWNQEGYLSRGQSLHLITNIIIEILFDIMQAQSISYQLGRFKPDPQPYTISLLDPMRLTELANRQAVVWANTPFARFSPNVALSVRDIDRLNHALLTSVDCPAPQALRSEEMTLRDLAQRMQKDVTDLAIAIVPVIQAGDVELLEIPDLPIPMCGSRLMEILQQSMTNKGKLIACVDDSMIVQLMMENIFQETPYRFMSIHDALLTVPLLLDNQPNLIFLNLDMPKISGYDLCLQIRKTTVLKDIPIVFLLESQNIFQRMQMKLSGATACLIKPLNAKDVIAMTQKLLLPQES